jgi:hypothetical protein
MPRGPNLDRRRDLEAALKRAKPKDEISLSGLADLYGSSKQNFVNVLRNIEKRFDMPPWREEEGTRQHLYPARAAIDVLLKWEKRNDAAHAERAKKTAAILGKAAGNRPKKSDSSAGEDALLPIGDMISLNRAMMLTEERERDQGLYCPLSDQAATAGRVFSLVSSFLSNLSANVDPNGLLPAEVRAVIDEGGHRTALKMHAEMKDMLSGDAIPRQRGGKGSRGATGRARRTRSRR